MGESLGRRESSVIMPHCRSVSQTAKTESEHICARYLYTEEWLSTAAFGVLLEVAELLRVPTLISPGADVLHEMDPQVTEENFELHVKKSAAGLFQGAATRTV